jgi:hypothetical protein
MHAGQSFTLVFTETNGLCVVLTHYNLTLTPPVGEPMPYTRPRPLKSDEQIFVPANGRIFVEKTVPRGWPHLTFDVRAKRFKHQIDFITICRTMPAI